MSNIKMNAIILASQKIYSNEEVEKIKKRLKKHYKYQDFLIGRKKPKALRIINGKPMVQYEINACNNSEHINDVFVVGDKSKLEKKLENCHIINSSGALIQNVLNGYNKSGSKGRVLILASDIPLIKTEHIDEFIENCLKYDTGIYFSITERRYLIGHEMRERDYIYLKNGDYRPSGLFMADTEKLNLEKVSPIIKKVYENRNLKSFFAKCKLVADLRGDISLKMTLPIIIRYCISHIDSKYISKYVNLPFLKNLKFNVNEVENLVKEVLDSYLKIIEIDHYEASVDIDTEQNLRKMRRLMSKY